MAAVKEALSGLDLAALVRELSEVIKGSRLANVYQLGKNKFLLKLRAPGGTFKLLVELGRYVSLTERDVEVPDRPTPFCMGLRKDLRGGRVLGLEQHDLDRVLMMPVSARAGIFKLVLELFGDGNLVLVGPDGRIRRVLRPRAMRDRKLLVGEPYRPPPGPKIGLMELEGRELWCLRELGELEVVRGLSRLTGLGGAYAEEVLLRAGIDKDRPCSSLTDEELGELSKAISELVGAVLRGPLEPAVVIEEDGEWVDVVPIRMLKYAGHDCVRFTSMNKAVDAYFSRLGASEELGKRLRELEERIKKLKERIKLQEEALKRFEEESSRYSRVGDTIFTHMHQLNLLLEALRDLREELGSWEAVGERLVELRSRGPPFSWLVGFSPRGPSISVEIDGAKAKLDLRSSAQEAASRCYERAKRARRKAEGAARALEESRKELEELISELRELQARVPEAPEEVRAEEVPRPAERRRRAWYEDFRWFYSSDGFLVVAGKDAGTNELIVKRYASPGDLLLHAEIPGAPFVLIKAGGRGVPRATVLEAAQMAVSYSRAWKYGLGVATAICFRPEQAKKVGPHGEKLPKGAFYILGKKEYIRNVELKLAIGASRREGRIEFFLGPVGAVSSRADAYVLIGPGDDGARKVVREALELLEAKLGPLEFQRQTIERLAALVPYGRGRLLTGK
ncbi:MAG TPA: fibronectin-binding domain-containing protein [Candidatus Bathyarchaeota archaeon]|nr:fibronectin-binding domain-containing protein [Candidatus Bathyarchaeota archaeon]